MTPLKNEDQRTALSADRTVYAAERTYAAWVRTGLTALASGVGAKALLTGTLPHIVVQVAGGVLTLFSAFCFGAAVWREVFPALDNTVPDTRRIPPFILYFVNGILALVALMAFGAILLR